MNKNFSPRSFPHINTLTRRDFLSRTLKAGGALGLAALTQVPPFARRALASGEGRHLRERGQTERAAGLERAAEKIAAGQGVDVRERAGGEV